jgi:hypothetical protein
VMGTNSAGTSYGSDLTFTTTCPTPLAAGTITGAANVCSPGTGYIYSVPAITWATTYNWTVPPGAIITGGGNTNSITVSFPAGSSSGNVSVFGSSICGTGTASPNLAVTVNALPVPTITGSTTLCVNSGYYNYTTETGMSNYLWTVSSGGVINSGSGTNQITVTWVTAGAQTVSVTYTSAAGCNAANPTVKNITVTPLPGPAGTITGIPSVCAGATGIHYSTTTIANATTYFWVLPSGATITAGAGTPNITVSFGANAVSGNITVAGNNLCGYGTVSAPYPVIVVQLPGAAGTVTGPNAVCDGDEAVVYSVTPIPNATGYEWTVPAGAIIVSGANTNTITVNFPPSTPDGIIHVYGTDYCGNGAVSPDLAVVINDIPGTPVISAVGYTLTSSVPVGNQWYHNGTAIAGATGQTYTATISGNYTCIVTLLGCSSAVSNTINIVITGTGDKSAENALSIYPNPSEGQFTLSIRGQNQETRYNLVILNNLGVSIFELNDVKVRDTFSKNIDLRPLPDGVYTVILRNGDQTIIRKVVINK